MRNLKDILVERLVLSKTKYTLFPKTKEELKEMIESEIEKNGNKCSLNHIDVSEITDMSKLFLNSEFNGDISEWDVSDVTNMKWMFAHSKFDGDISKWDVSNVENMSYMFYCVHVPINNISKWKVNPDADFTKMFSNSYIDQDLSSWKINKTNHKRDEMFWNTDMAFKNRLHPQLV